MSLMMSEELRAAIPNLVPNAPAINQPAMPPALHQPVPNHPMIQVPNTGNHPHVGLNQPMIQVPNTGNHSHVTTQNMYHQTTNSNSAQILMQVQLAPSRRPTVRQKRHRPSTDHFHSVSNPLTYNAPPCVEKKQRPLNSYMAFRAFYRSLFPGLPQKEISAYLTTLWQCDPSQAKWAIVAKAYSLIRDVMGKRKAPLNEFLDIACPAIGILGVSSYLQSLNWIITTNTLGEREIQQTSQPDLTSLNLSTNGFNLSESDVLELCMQRGYIPPHLSNLSLFGSGTQGLMGVTNIRTPKEKFQHRAKLDPVGVAAEIFGFDVKNPFFEVSTAPFNPHIAPITDNGDSEMLDLFQNFNEDNIELPQTDSEQYAWTGTMADLYNPDEASIEFDRLFDMSEFNTMDITDAQALDDFVNDDLFSQPTDIGESLHYDFGDSY